MNLTVRAPLNTQLGYGHAGWNIIKEIRNQGHGVCLFPLGQNYHLSPEDVGIIQQIQQESFSFLDHSNPCLLIWHEFALFQQFTCKGKYIAFPFFEVNELDPLRQHNLNYCDEVFVASQWAKEVLESNNVGSHISVIPLGVDTEIFKPKVQRQDETYKFFTVGKIEKRKCTEMLADIFSAAFDENDKVEFHIICDSPLPQIQQQMPEIRERFTNSKLGDKIFLHPNVPFDRDLASFIQDKNCGLFLTRAEGFGLPILQSMACGKPVITTDYSAQTEFCNEKNARLINISEFEPAIDNIWFHGLGTWAKIGNREVEQCIEYMRECYKNRPSNIDGVDTARQFSWKVTCERIISRVES